MRTGFSADGRRSVVVVANGTGSGEQLLAAERAVRGLVDRALCAGTQDIAGSRPSATLHNSR
ncbi:hypothetical protein [Streptomyces althioticus]|uniref:hypothetical protein n=1 Tax=Streptomyces althioticus TaxID=83380 RepID=UPI0036A0A871